LPAQGALAAHNLLEWVALHPRDAYAWELLGQALGLQGDSLRSIRAQAESLALKFDFAAAIDRLIAAQELAREWGRKGRLDRAQEMEAAIIDSRLRTLQLARREQTLQR
jgi:predicted Zn-dependent protease